MIFNDPHAEIYGDYPLDPSSSSLAGLPNSQMFSSQPMCKDMTNLSGRRKNDKKVLHLRFQSNKMTEQKT